jgi:hypothetical protein
MADRFIPGTHPGSFGTIISEGYAKSIVTGPPEPPEPPRVEDRKLTCRDLQKRFRATAEEVEEIIAMPEFPVAGRRTSAGSWEVTLVWSERAVDLWAEKQRRQATRTLELLG